MASTLAWGVAVVEGVEWKSVLRQLRRGAATRARVPGRALGVITV